MIDLTDKMRKLADSGHSKADDLRMLAKQYEEAHNGYLSEPPTVNIEQLLECWAKARILFGILSSEDLT